MATIKKNKIHNPQIISDPIPSTITDADIGRLWVDLVGNTVKICIKNKDTGLPEIRNILDNSDISEITGDFFKGIKTEIKTVELQTSGDKHYDEGYDFFSDNFFIENSNQQLDDYYSFYYIEVPSTDSQNYLRTISTDLGVKHVRKAIGTDTFIYNSESHKVVNYTKVILTQSVKEIVDIVFENKDMLISGYELSSDKKTILIYSDPEGFFNNKQVIVKYLI